MKKKSIAIILSFVIGMTALAGCGGNSTSQSSQEDVAAAGASNGSAVQEAVKEENSNESAELEKDESSEEVKQNDKTEKDIKYGIGDTWVVDGQWAVTVNGVEETDQRNEYSDKTPEAVYIVTYTYENLGYEDNDGLFVPLDDTIIDNAGKMGYSYPGDIIYYADDTPVGAYCEAQVCIGVDNPGAFTIQYSSYDDTGNKQSATFEIDPSVAPVEASRVGQYQLQSDYKLGDTWEVEGQWKLTVTDVQKTDERNEYSELEPEAVYIVSYTYENLGYVDEDGSMDGLFIPLDDIIIDSDGKMGYSYPVSTTDVPMEAPVGATCDAQVCIGVDHAGSFEIGITNYDGNNNKQRALFECPVINE